MKALIATDGRDGPAEKESLQNACRDVPHRDTGSTKAPIGPCVDIELKNADKKASENAHQIGIDN